MSMPHVHLPRTGAKRRPRPLWRVLLVLGAIGAILYLPGTAGAAATPAHAGSPAAAGTAVTTVGAPSAAAAPAAGTVSPARGTAIALAALTPRGPVRPSAPSGACQVPGIGDIGSLLGLCQAGSGFTGLLNNICQPAVPTPEPATGGIDSLVKPPAAGGAGTGTGKTLYDAYGMAGQSWAAFDLGCSDMASLIGNNIAGVVFDAAKAVDRVTITVYQSAAGTGILSWLTNSVDRLVTALGNAIYFPYLAPVIILGAVWLAWQGLIRRRATRSIEGTLWMVIACAAAIWLIGRPGDFTGFGKDFSDGITQTLNVAFAKLPAPEQSNCVPIALKPADPQSPALASYSYTSGDSVVDRNASELWTVLVCKPWLDGEFGTTAYATPGKGKPTVVNNYGRQLLWAQAIAANEHPTSDVITAKQDTYAGIASAIKQKYPGVYPLFQGKQWTTRLEIAFAAMFAALLAGVLVLLVAITLIVLKLGFLLLLVAGPFFLIIGTHPGFGRVVALRWGELLIGVLLKQAAIALVLSVLLYAYSLIMGASDAVLPWALKILMISLVTVAVFIYRKPFTHLFSAVGYGVIGARERADAQLATAGASAARNTLDAATVAVPGFAAYRAARWARRNPAQAVALAAQIATAGSASALAASAAGAAGTAGTAPGAANGAGPDSPSEGGGPTEPAPDGEGQPTGTRTGAGGRARGAAGVGTTTGRTPPPLDLPPRDGEAAPSPSGWARGDASAAGRYRGSAPAPTGYGVPATGNGAGAAAPSGNGPGSLGGNGAGARSGGAGWPGGAGSRSGGAGSRSGGAGSRGGGAGSRGNGAGSPGGNGGAAPGGGNGGAASGGGNGRAPVWPGAGPWLPRNTTPARPARNAARPQPGPAAPRPAPSGPGSGPFARGNGNGNGTGPATAAGQGNGNGDTATASSPFWLRPLRRQK
jgi:hypothetical protein